MSRRNIEENAQGLIIGVLVSEPVAVTSSGNPTETCPICRRIDWLEQDHDHATDLCRGRICHACNVLIGRFDRPVEEIARQLAYLRYWRRRNAVAPSQTYTEYMREAIPGYRARRRSPRRRKAAA